MAPTLHFFGVPDNIFVGIACLLAVLLCSLLISLSHWRVPLLSVSEEREAIIARKGLFFAKCLLLLLLVSR